MDLKISFSKKNLKKVFFESQILIRKYFAQIAWSVIDIIFPDHVIHDDFDKHSASNATICEEIDSNSMVSTLNGLDLAFQRLGSMPSLEAHFKTEPMTD